MPHTPNSTYPGIPWQPWSSGNSEKIMITIQLPEWRTMEGEVIAWQTLSNARRWCIFVFLLVSFKCVPLAIVRESFLSWDKYLFPFAVRDVAGKSNVRNHLGLEWWGEWLHQGQGDTVILTLDSKWVQMVGMNVMDHIEESMWYKRLRDEGKLLRGQLFKGNGYVFKSSVLGVEESLMSKWKKKKRKPSGLECNFSSFCSIVLGIGTHCRICIFLY